MEVKKRLDIRAAYLQRIIDLMNGKKEMRAIFYPERGDDIHISDLQLCPMPPYFRRTMENPPDISADAAMRFLRGRVIERAIGSELPPIKKDDIWMTVDDNHPEFGLAEIKSTAEGLTFFSPEKAHPEWMERIMGYCCGYGTTRMNLIVFFLTGNAQDYMGWMIKKNGMRPAKWQGIELLAWTIDFAENEILNNWDEMLRRRDVLKQAVETKTMIAKEEIEARRPAWMCGNCIYGVNCPYVGEKKPWQPSNLFPARQPRS